MPRARKDPRGGPRVGQAGKAYPQRSDLSAQPVATAPSQGYGQATAQRAAQQAIPLPGPPRPAPAQAAPPSGPGPIPGALGDPMRPSERPNEPVTAGIDAGAGPGANVLPPTGNSTLDQLRAIYQAFPDESLREILEDLEMEGGFVG